MFVGRVLLDEMCESYSHSDSSGHDKDFENVCSALSAQIFNPSRGDVHYYVFMSNFRISLQFQILVVFFFNVSIYYAHNLLIFTSKQLIYIDNKKMLYKIF